MDQQAGPEGTADERSGGDMPYGEDNRQLLDEERAEEQEAEWAAQDG